MLLEAPFETIERDAGERKKVWVAGCLECYVRMERR